MIDNTARLAGRLLLTGFEGHTLAASPHIVEHARAGRIGGVLLLGRNCHDRDQLKKLCEEIHALPSPHRLVTTIDQEGGAVLRTPWLSIPSAREVVNSCTHEQAEALYGELAEELRWLGVDWNFAPCVDLDIDPDSPAIGRYGRSFGADAETVADYAAAIVRAHRSHGVRTCLKHFPGHGSAGVDTHEGLADITQTWRETELRPYGKLIAAGLADAVMTGHLLHRDIDVDNPATLSSSQLQVLRGKLGWDGVLVSDDMQMGALRRYGATEERMLKALLAGVDVFIAGEWLERDPQLPLRWTALAQRAVADGRISLDRLKQAAERLERLFAAK